jgi:hypothetical protein
MFAHPGLKRKKSLINSLCPVYGELIIIMAQKINN